MGRLGRDQDLEARASALALLDPGAPAVEGGELRDQREPDAGARDARDLVPAGEELEDRIAPSMTFKGF